MPVQVPENNGFGPRETRPKAILCGDELFTGTVCLINENATIDNKNRVLIAAKKLYRNFLLITAGTNNWMEVKENISSIIGDPIEEIKLDYQKQKDERIKQWRKLLNDETKDHSYDKNKWFKEAINEEIKFWDDKKIKFDPIKDKLSFKENYKKTNWFKFQEAIKDYQRIATHKMKPILEQMEIKEW